MNKVCKPFNDLSPRELYDILQLRSEVFVVEQNCVYLDPDGKDDKAMHLCIWENGILMAYARLLPPGVAYEEASIGRVVSNPRFRKNGFGRLLMKEAIKITLKEFKVSDIKIGAQLYLRNFYESLGFSQKGDEYLEDGIPHIPMLFK